MDDFPPFYFGERVFFDGAELCLTPTARAALRILIEAAPYPVIVPGNVHTLRDSVRRQFYREFRKTKWHVRNWGNERYSLEPDGYQPGPEYRAKCRGCGRRPIRRERQTSQTSV